MVTASTHNESNSEFVARVLGIGTPNHSSMPFVQFAPQYLRVQTKSGLIVPLELRPLQIDLIPKLTGRDLIVKARQLGLSTIIQALQFRRVAYQPYRAAALAHDAHTTALMRSIHNMFYSYLPDAIKPDRSQNNASTITYMPQHGRVTLTTAGNQDAGIGTSYNEVHGTEVARWKNADGIMSGLMQGVPAEGRIILESSPYGARGWFYERCMEANDGNNAWTLHFYPWWWEPRYSTPLADGESLDLTGDEQHLVELHDLTPEQIKWRRAKMKELPHTFKQEYPEDVLSCFLSGGNSVFGDFEFCLLTQEEHQTEPIEGHRYMAGADWGQEDDYTTLSIIDATDDVEVFIGRWHKMPWDEMQNRIADACGRWNVETIQPEKNSIGSVNIENLHDKFIDVGLDITIRPVTMNNRRKQKLVSNLYNGIHNEGLRLLNEDFATSEMRTFISKQLESGQYKFEHAEGAHDDTVIARMLDWDACCKMI